MTVERRTDAWGRVILNPKSAFEAIYSGHDLWDMIVEDSQEITQFNEMCRKFDHLDLIIETPEEPELSPEEEHAKRASTWLINDDILQIPVREFLLGLCKTEEERQRVLEEMVLYEERNLVPLLQLMMYLVDHFRRNKIVWGVGRGSSVSSYCLYLIGVHKVNSLKYGLEIAEFLK